MRIPFYAQCYPTAVFALGLGLGTSLALVSYPLARLGGSVLAVISLLNYTIVQTRWFALKLGTGYPRAAGNVVLILLEGTAVFIIVGFLFAR